MNEFASYNENNIPKNLLTYDGKTGKIFGILIKNFFLNIITLGIYRAWAKTNMRKYTFSSFAVDGSRLEYSGKGGELFKGFVIVAVFYFVLALAVDFAIEIFYPEEAAEISALEDSQQDAAAQEQNIKLMNEANELNASRSEDLVAVTSMLNEFDVDHCLETRGAEKCEELYTEYLEYIEKRDVILEKVDPQFADTEQSPLSPAAAILMGAKGLFFLITFMLFMFFATFSAFRYRLTRTRYKGIHGAVRGATAKGYVWLRLRRFFLNLITLGFTIGRSDLIAQKYILQNSYVGKTQFKFEPNVKALDKTNLITGLLAIPTAFISRTWYKAALLNEKYNNLSIGGVKMESKFTGGKLFWLRFSNLLLLVISFGLLSAYVLNRSLKFFNNHVSMRGNEADLKLVQDSADSGTIGEGLDEGADFGGFDVDFGMI